MSLKIKHAGEKKKDGSIMVRQLKPGDLALVYGDLSVKLAGDHTRFLSLVDFTFSACAPDHWVTKVEGVLKWARLDEVIPDDCCCESEKEET